MITRAVGGDRQLLDSICRATFASISGGNLIAEHSANSHYLRARKSTAVTIDCLYDVQLHWKALLVPFENIWRRHFHEFSYYFSRPCNYEFIIPSSVIF